jgi:arsenate reductase
MNLLVLCTGNSCRSQIAHGFLQQLLGRKANVYSAGIETHGVNPRAIATMKDAGIDISSHTSNNLTEYLQIPFDYVITVCDNASERCPVFPGSAKRVHHNFTDPAKASGTETEIMNEFARVRDEIQSWCQQFVKENIQ